MAVMARQASMALRAEETAAEAATGAVRQAVPFLMPELRSSSRTPLFQLISLMVAQVAQVAQVAEELFPARVPAGAVEVLPLAPDSLPWTPMASSRLAPLPLTPRKAAIAL